MGGGWCKREDGSSREKERSWLEEEEEEEEGRREAEIGSWMKSKQGAASSVRPPFLEGAERGGRGNFSGRGWLDEGGEEEEEERE